VRRSEARELVGRVLDSRYRIDAYLGCGATGSVFAARHVRLPRSFAIKVLHPRLLSDPKVVKRFEREARLAGKLSHPNVVSVLDLGEVDGLSYMVMDLAVGPRLSDQLVRGAFDPSRALRILRQLCDGLDHAHSHGLIHRDLKPDNVIVEWRAGEEVARIVDFGIAILHEADSSSPEGRVTTGGLVLGTPGYMAPELAAGRPFDHRVDLFALGVVAYQALCGRMPFDGSGVEVLHANVHLDAPAMATRAPQVTVDPELEAFARRLMARQPDARFPTAAAARDALDRLDCTAPGTPIARIPPTSVRVPPRQLTTREVQALGSAETIAVATLEIAAELSPQRTASEPARAPLSPTKQRTPP
jgi:serine/threonine-protein kinase